MGSIKNLTGQPLLNNVGSIIQVVYSDMGSNTATIATQDNSVIPNCSVAITPTRASSKILLLAHIVHNGWYVSSFGFARNGVNIGGNNNTNSANAISTNFEGAAAGTDSGWCMATTYQYLDSPNTTATTTYAATACSSWNGVIYTIRINDRNSLDMRSLSSIVAMEILA